MKSFKEIYDNPKITVAESIRDQFIFGSFRFNDGTFASFVCGFNENGLDHVSVAPYKKTHTPTWDEMCQVKDACWRDDEEAYQMHPPKSEYVNLKDNCLHIWARHDGKKLGDL